MRHLVSRIRDFNEQLGDELAFEKLLAEMYKAQIEERISEGHNHWESLERDLKEKRTFNKERLETMEKLSSRESSDKNWSQFTKFANALGIGAAGLAVGSNPVSIAVFLVGVGLAADSIMDDWTKKQISSLITDDSQQQEKYTSAMQLGAGICSVAIFAGLASAGNTGVFADVSKGAQVGFNSAVELAQGGAAIGGGVSRYNSNIHQADMKEINDKIDKKSEDMKKDSGKMKSLVENVQQYYRNLSDIQRAQLETATAMIKA
jgi:hypothetical protein